MTAESQHYEKTDKLKNNGPGDCIGEQTSASESDYHHEHLPAFSRSHNVGTVRRIKY